ncbi:hypothetical protein NKG94_20165 [Micromonospora sp. M12]
MLGFLLVNLILAGLLHRFVETPMMRRLAPRRPARPASVPQQRTAGTRAAGTDAAPDTGGVESRTEAGPDGGRSPYVDSR